MQPKNSYGRRAASYWFADGLPEIVFGLALVVFATLAFLWRAFAPQPWIDSDWIIVYASMLVYLFLERGILDFLKSRITYPRTGYVQPPKEGGWSRRPLNTLSLRPELPGDENATFFQLRTGGPILVFFFLFMPSEQPLGRWLVPLAMPIVAIILYAASRMSERPYRWWSALVLALTGPACLLVNVPRSFQPTLPLLLTGGWLLAEGMGRLLGYLRMNPYPRTVERARA